MSMLRIREAQLEAFGRARQPELAAYVAERLRAWHPAGGEISARALQRLTRDASALAARLDLGTYFDVARVALLILCFGRDFQTGCEWASAPPPGDFDALWERALRQPRLHGVSLASDDAPRSLDF